MKRLLISSSFYRALEAIWAAVTMLIVTPIVIKALGAESYGLWLLILSSVGLLSFFELGFASAIQRRMAQLIENNDPRRLNSLFSSAFFIFLFLSIVAFTCVLLIAINPLVLGVHLNNKPFVFDALFLLSIKLVFDFVANCFHGIFSGHLKFDIDSKVSIVAITIKAVLMVLLVKDYGFLSLVLITLFVDISVHIIKFFIAYRIQPSLSLSVPVNFSDDVIDLSHYAKHVVLIELSRLIQDKSVTLFISHLFGLVTISIFSIADRLIRQAYAMIQTITGVLQPFLIRKLEKGELSESLMQNSMLIHTWLSCVVFLPVMLCGPAFIMLWVGSDFSESADLLHIFVLAFFLKVLVSPISHLLLAHAKHQKIALLEITASIIYITLLIILGNEFGLIGVVWGGVLSSLLVHAIGYVFLADKILGIKFYFSLSLIFKTQFIFWLSYFFNKYFHVFTMEMTWLELIFSVFMSTLFSVLVGFYFILNKDLRRILLSLRSEKN
ncbi:MAG: hypothetical protein NWQ54_21885 [Paraglaciecola sp.]|uniref:lipopolysaccharide biosynthesis protein n=1 Tax=Alteromonadaceae TaxID=72275 RepID=UPI00273ED6AA|nr:MULTISPECIES: oligosaccharide flippase family protein [Alteromonadaceae]MDP5031311.1 hypothetical protein [Paraglaciecola sp.]MDP5133543.1 hypothetical protein [Paraglaciecola sp.]MDP5458155.1 hypothetical protein [Alishewanella sp. SMS8]